MNQVDPNKRRNFVRLMAGSALAVPFFSANQSFGGGHLPKLEEDDPQAMALGYKHDTTAVDGSAYPTHDPANTCAGCALYQGKEGDEWGECSIFPGKEVAAAGWCNAFAPKT